MPMTIAERLLVLNVTACTFQHSVSVRCSALFLCALSGCAHMHMGRDGFFAVMPSFHLMFQLLARAICRTQQS